MFWLLQCVWQVIGQSRFIRRKPAADTAAIAAKQKARFNKLMLCLA
jgi:hypothetical protein